MGKTFEYKCTIEWIMRLHSWISLLEDSWKFLEESCNFPSDSTLSGILHILGWIRFSLHRLLFTWARFYVFFSTMIYDSFITCVVLDV